MEWETHSARTDRAHAQTPRSNGGHYAFAEAHDTLHRSTQRQHLGYDPEAGAMEWNAQRKHGQDTRRRAATGGGHYAFLWRSKRTTSTHRSTAEATLGYDPGSELWNGRRTALR
jgi:hypothetical protein